MIYIESFWLELMLLLTLAVVGHLIIVRLGQPMVIGELLIGIAIGPSLLGYVLDIQILDPDILTNFAELGAIILLFVVGLECDLREIYTKKNLAVAAGGVVIPWLSGFMIAILLGEDSITAIFLGVLLVATSVGVTAAVLLEMKLLDLRIAKTILGAAVIDDVLGMVILAIATGLSIGEFSASSFLFLTLAAVLFVSVGAYIGSKYLTKLILFVERKSKARGIELSGFLLALAITFLYAFIADLIGISAIVGAFVAGTMFSSISLKKEFHEGTKYLGAIFIPIFFISIGLLVDLRNTFNYIFLGISLTVVAILSKLVGCGVPARAFEMSKKESLAVGVGMIPRGEVALIVALYGFTVGIINQALYSVSVLMVLLTTLIAPPLFRYIMAKEKPITNPIFKLSPHKYVKKKS